MTLALDIRVTRASLQIRAVLQASEGETVALLGPNGSGKSTVVDCLAGLTGDAVGPFGRITFHPLLTKAFRTPLVRLPEEDIVFVFNLIRILASNDAAVAERTDCRPAPPGYRCRSWWPLRPSKRP